MRDNDNSDEDDDDDDGDSKSNNNKGNIKETQEVQFIKLWQSTKRLSFLKNFVVRRIFFWVGKDVISFIILAS